MESISNHTVQTLEFQIPTQATNLEPVFIFKFEIDEMLPTQNNRVNVKLNPKLFEDKAFLNNGMDYVFDENGQCKIYHQETNHYFVKGELKLKGVRNTENGCGYCCLANMTYGNAEKELHYIKGVFKLLKNKEVEVCP
jgi:hypothetical protein